MRLLGKIMRGALLGILSALLLLNVWQLASRWVFGQRLPGVCGFSPVIVLSGSMEPAFAAGDLLIIQKQDTYQVGDVVTYEAGGSFVTHRIVERTPAGFTTKGDYNNAPDLNPVSAERIKGAVVLLVPRLGSFFLFLRTPAGLLLLMGAGLLVLFIPDLLNSFRSNKKGCAD